ncbi:MAG: carboxypeptidase-like regulatory domain-containing protein, partial [Bacteroidetes bacterium]|nr:carboxypeptidase-like regulatory domain-containing protein [Bacteroidota bacterium]
MKTSRTILLLSSLFLFCQAIAQKKAAFISGKIIGENEMPLAKVSVTILGKQTGIATNDSGVFRMRVPAEKAFGLVFSFT